ncbi:hypothetical protein RB195_025763 [Necator americanus]|uniref:DUF4773 domain-containing protein n=1 Tax=Necator americanus TaxID=51031 RepID=A0ABR1EVT0_NECAM
MFTLLIPIIFVGFAHCNTVTTLKYSIYPNKVDIGETLPVSVYKLLNDSKQLKSCVNSIAIHSHDHLRGFALLRNDKNALGLVKLNHESIDQDTFAFSLGGRSGQMKISTNQLRINLDLSTLPREFVDLLGADENSCSCVHGNCACCASVKIPDFHHDFCVNATYNRKTIGLDLSIGIDGHYYTQEISVRNPPPICISAPYAHDIAGICVAFKDLDVSKEKRTLSGCVELEIEVIHMRVVQLHLGCFVMPI